MAVLVLVASCDGPANDEDLVRDSMLLLAVALKPGCEWGARRSTRDNKMSAERGTADLPEEGRRVKRVVAFLGAGTKNHSLSHSSDR